MTEPTAWVEADLDAIRHNYRAVREYAGAPLMAVLKTNAYGHGLDLVAAALKDDADWYGVSTLEEGIRARAAAPEMPILVFQPTGPWNAQGLLAHRLTATVDSEAGAKALAGAGRAAGTLPEAHLKLDTGMGRFGVPPEGTAVLGALAAVPGIAWTGVYTHLATAADRDTARASAQAARFRRGLAAASGAGLPVTGAHILNSAGILRFQNERHAMVRSGTLLYGQYPSASGPRPLALKPTWAFRARIVSIRRIRAGETVGYGAEWVARRESVIATIPVGYYDGFTVEPLSVWRRGGGLKGLAKRLAGRDRLTVQTERGPAPVVGRVAAQSAMLDVTDLPSIGVGDVVTVPARRVLVGDHIPRIAAVGHGTLGIG